MRLQDLTAILAFLGPATAAPTNEKRAVLATGAKQYTVKQVPAVNPGHKVAGPIVYAKALKKYSRLGLSVPVDVDAAANKAAGTNDGTVVANPEQFDSQYLEQVTIGNQVFDLNFDSGSSDLWVFGSSLPASQQVGHTIYKPGATAKILSGASWRISYGDGSSASGNVYTDTVSVGKTTVKGQAVEVAKRVSASFASTDGDGLVGLAFSSINTVTPTKQKTFFDNAAASLSKPLYAVDLKKGRPGTYDFGFIDAGKYTGDIVYTPVDSSQGFWSFTADGYKIGNGRQVSSQLTGIADTGTTLILLDDTTVAAYWGSVGGAVNDQQQGGYVFPCSKVLPDWTVVISGRAFTVPGSYLNYAPVDQTGTTCYGGLQSSGSVGIGIFGDVFLKAVYSVFDASGPRLGFASKTL